MGPVLTRRAAELVGAMTGGGGEGVVLRHTSMVVELAVRWSLRWSARGKKSSAVQCRVYGIQVQGQRLIGRTDSSTTWSRNMRRPLGDILWKRAVLRLHRFWIDSRIRVGPAFLRLR